MKRCSCGCIMELIDKSTEEGYDYDYQCNNRNCSSNTEPLQVPSEYEGFF